MANFGYLSTDDRLKGNNSEASAKSLNCVIRLIKLFISYGNLVTHIDGCQGIKKLGGLVPASRLGIPLRYKIC